MTESILATARSRMEESLAALGREFTTVRTGKATPALLDGVRVEAYGSTMPIGQLATVTAPDATLLLVQPFDRSIMQDVARAIMAADLGLNPSNDGTVIRVPIPPLTEERRKEYARLLHRMTEDARISVRHARKLGRDAVSALLKDHEIGEDDARRTEDAIDRLTQEHVGKIDELLAAKEAEVMAI